MEELRRAAALRCRAPQLIMSIVCLDDAVQEGVAALLQKVDADKSGDLSLSEFKALFEVSVGKCYSRMFRHALPFAYRFCESLLSLQVARLRKVFEEIDKDRSGSISTAEMVDALGQLGVRVTKGETARMISEIDGNNDGTISWPEFYSAFELVPLASLQAVANKWASVSQLDIGSDLAPLLVCCEWGGGRLRVRLVTTRIVNMRVRMRARARTHVCVCACAPMDTPC